MAGSDSNEPPSDVKLLAIGDVHLGLRPSRIPECGVEPSLLTPAAALASAVDCALRERVAAVLFAGDVVESDNARFEAIRPLEEAVSRLASEGIPVFAVVGNHDVEALPRLARLIDGFELIGEGGRWESRVIEAGGRPVVEVVGWSFPERRFHGSPVAELLRSPVEPRHPGLPRLGLMHGDMNASGGGYAPFRRHELDSAGLDGWLLGHIHKPSLTGSGGSGEPGRASGEAPCGYLGSLVGLDPGGGEMGPHGPWLVHIESRRAAGAGAGSGAIRVEQLAIAPLRWERLSLDVSQLEVEDIGDAIVSEAHRLASRIEAEESGTPPLVLGLRVALVGRTHQLGAIQEEMRRSRWNEIQRVVKRTVVFVDKVEDRLELALDLADLARRADPPGLLARKLLVLEGGGEGEERSALLAAARAQLRPVSDAGRWDPLAGRREADDPLSDESLAATLRHAAFDALSTILAQRSPSRPGGSAAAQDEEAR